ncbi:MAG: translation initiation factor IF-2 N-terminal domain-containing protein, partial [Acidobacteria bacterium]|nr:translation initiation factor IF-2 N-terminal domain-containing protein [Acidobacteriota bacterium]
MTAHTSKVRLYDLAKELKLDTKRLIEEVRREGVDVSVPSNSISKELADKIRNKYFPKKETTAPRKVVVIKHAVRPAAPAAEETEAAPVATEAAAPVSSEDQQQVFAETSAETVAEPSAEGGQAASKPIASRILLKKKPQPPAQRAEPPATPSTAPPIVEPSLEAEPVAVNGAGDPAAIESNVTTSAPPTPDVEQTSAAQTSSAPPAEAAAPDAQLAPAAANAPSRQVRV